MTRSGSSAAAASRRTCSRRCAVPATANGVRIVGALARPGRGEAARAELGEHRRSSNRSTICSRAGPALVAEVAGQQRGGRAWRGGAAQRRRLPGDLGRRARRPELLARLKSAAQDGNSRILLPAGAIGGIDAIAAMRVAGLTAVRYRSRKPPAAWRGSPAEKVADLDKLTQRTVLYTRHRAAKPRCSIRRTPTSRPRWRWPDWASTPRKVELVADPDAPGNVHEIEAEGAAGKFAIQLQGKPSRTNPKTSALAAMSVARALLNAARDDRDMSEANPVTRHPG